jgi:hypothetical protein
MTEVRVPIAARVQLLLCASSLIATVLTVAYPTWIEMTLGLDPDHDSGLVEWLALLVTASAAALSGLRARRNLRLSRRGGSFVEQPGVR